MINKHDTRSRHRVGLANGRRADKRAANLPDSLAANGSMVQFNYHIVSAVLSMVAVTRAPSPLTLIVCVCVLHDGPPSGDAVLSLWWNIVIIFDSFPAAGGYASEAPRWNGYWCRNLYFNQVYSLTRLSVMRRSFDSLDNCPVLSLRSSPNRYTFCSTFAKGLCCYLW